MLRAQSHGPQARPADLIDAPCRSFLGQASVDMRLTRRVLALRGGQHLPEYGFRDIRLVDAGPRDQLLEHGRAAVVAVNKWDGMSDYDRERIRGALERKLTFAPWLRIHFISALHGSGVGEMYRSIHEAWTAATADLSTNQLSTVLEDAVREHAPPLRQGRRIKLRYAHQGGSRPPLIIIHGNQTEHLPDTYKRFLENRFRSAFSLHGTPMRIETKSSENPFAGRKNVLTERQARKRKRLVKHLKKRGR
jgi:GTP-binding protein